ncbi:hypothetical protein WJX72_004719 [[Myrmecia] bisecta]|uniref:Kinesin light chain n=1 Tax=[Myrmecia] bisecta TaxID=41462 RepID=A0AAW1P9Q8_9CHLO
MLSAASVAAPRDPDKELYAAQTEQLWRSAAELAHRVFGPDDEHTSIITTQLAEELRLRNKLQEAREIYVEQLDRSQQVLGSSHERTLGKRMESLELYVELLERSQQVLGPAHEVTLRLVSSVAALCHLECHINGGRDSDSATFQAAIMLVWEFRKQALGPEHPNTLETMQLWADSLQQQGDYWVTKAMRDVAGEVQQPRAGGAVQALPLLRAIADIDPLHMHPDAVGDLCKFVTGLVEAGQIAEAITIFRGMVVCKLQSDDLVEHRPEEFLEVCKVLLDARKQAGDQAELAATRGQLAEYLEKARCVYAEADIAGDETCEECERAGNMYNIMWIVEYLGDLLDKYP